jgi:hypothetical protein
MNGWLEREIIGWLELVRLHALWPRQRSTDYAERLLDDDGWIERTCE